MKKILFLAVAILTSLATLAQTEAGTIVLTPRVGATFCDYNGRYLKGPIEVDTKGHFGLTGGVEAGYQVNDWFLPTVGVSYVNDGTKFKLNDKDNTLLQETVANWIAFPVMANFYVLKGLALKAGVQPALMLNSKDKVSGEGMYFKLNTLDFQFPVGISYELFGFILDARYVFSTIHLEREAEYNHIAGYPFERKEAFKNHHFTLTLGYKFKFKGPKLPKLPEVYEY